MVFSRASRRVPDSLYYFQNPLYQKEDTDFEGRAEVFQHLDNCLFPQSTQSSIALPKTCVICGPGGIGKTQSALQYFHRRKADFDIGLWVQANNIETLKAAYTQIAIKLNLVTLDSLENGPNHEPKVVDWLRKPFREPWNKNSRRMKWLLVLDNAIEDRILADYLPSHAEGCVVITTSDPLVGERRDSFGDGFVLRPLLVTEAVNLLRKKLPEQLCKNESDDVLAEVVNKLTCWPLAIVQIAGKMHRLRQTPSRFLRNFDRESERAEYFDNLEDYPAGYKHALSSHWSLGAREAPTSRLLSVISLLMPEDIPEHILEDASHQAGLSGYPISATGFDLALSELEKTSTISRNLSSESRGITIHSLAQSIVRAQLLKDESHFVEVFDCTLRLVMAVWDNQTLPLTRYREVAATARWKLCDRLLPHLENLRKMRDLLSPEGKGLCATPAYVHMLNELGWHHYMQRDLDDALSLVHATMEIVETDPNAYLNIRAGQYATWAAVALRLDQPDVAREKYYKCFQINEAIFSSEKIITSQYVASYSELGRILIANGELDEAAKLIEESARLRKQMPNFNRLQLFSPTLFLSFIDAIRGDLGAAEARLQEALRDREMHYGKNDTQSKRAGELLFALGNVVTKAGRYAEGFEYHHRALEIMQKAGGPEDFDTARVYYKLAAHYLRDRSHETAKVAIDATIATFQSSKYFKSELSRALFMRSNILRRLGKASEADEDFQECIRARRTIVRDELKPLEALTERDFDDAIIMYWVR